MNLINMIMQIITMAMITILTIRNVTAWWRDDWSDLPSTFPIHDFVRSTNMVQVNMNITSKLS